MDSTTLLADLLADPEAREVFDRHVPGVINTPVIGQMSNGRLGMVVHMLAPTKGVDVEALWADLAPLGTARGARQYAPRVDPDPAYEDESVQRGSAPVELPVGATRWGVAEVVLAGPSHGNPFVDVELSARFHCGDEMVEVGGFYDGDGTYRLRVMAEHEGTWTFRTASSARSLDGIEGSFEVGPARADAHGPVRVDGYHFRYADGTRHTPIGTTCYAWTHQPQQLQEQTLATLARSPFSKLRMCLFPKSYQYNANEPERFPFARDETGDGFDLETFDVEYFRHLEGRIRDLAGLGIEADLILFHAYDRWGFADLGPAADDRVVAYTVRRLAAFANVWWSMANEYDLLWAKSTEDWERLAAVVVANDPHRHLVGIHHCFGFYDQSRPWVTHVSAQRIDVYRTAENTNEWRDQWGKPVVIDEIGYEGDIDWGWGNLTGEELTRRFWEGAVRGGYVGHGETYVNDREQLWWSKGGELVGSSPERIAFLRTVIDESPTGVLDPLPSDWDLPWGGVSGEYHVAYFGFNRPSFRIVVLPPGQWVVDVIDTWAMTVDTLPGLHEGMVRVELPSRQYMAIRLRRSSRKP